MNQPENHTPVTVRVPLEIKQLIEKAAVISGMTRSAFIKSVLVDRSHEVIKHYGLRVLSDCDRDAFLAMLEKPANPNAALRADAEALKKLCETGNSFLETQPR